MALRPEPHRWPARMQASLTQLQAGTVPREGSTAPPIRPKRAEGSCPPCSWKLRYELDGFRNFERRKSCPGVLNQRKTQVLGSSSIRYQNHVGRNAIAKVIVRNSDNRRLGYRRVLHKCILDFLRRDKIAAALEQIVVAALVMENSRPHPGSYSLAGIVPLALMGRAPLYPTACDSAERSWITAMDHKASRGCPGATGSSIPSSRSRRMPEAPFDRACLDRPIWRVADHGLHLTDAIHLQDRERKALAPLFGHRRAHELA